MRMTTTFQRARSEEQRAQRRQTILDTAAAMLEEAPVAELSLNELSRRVGLAKSNVLRYFDSREAVLLELLTQSVGEWIGELGRSLAATVRRGSGFDRRAAQVAGVIAQSLQARPVLCDLMSAQSAVLEHNVPAEVLIRHKLAGIAEGERLTGHVREALPELGDEDAWKYLVAIWLMTAALWAYARPPEAVVAALAADDRLVRSHLDFDTALADYLETVAFGLRARARA
jgi:AcrR family transcriptional regulator